MLAVLENAVEYFQKYVLAQDEPNGKKLFQEAEEWFLEKDSDGLFSFENSLRHLAAAPRLHTAGLARPGRKPNSS